MKPPPCDLPDNERYLTINIKVAHGDYKGKGGQGNFQFPELIAPDFVISDDGIPPGPSIPFRTFRGDQFGMVRLEAGDHLLSVGGGAWAEVQEFTVRIEPAPPLVLVP